jgi:hypothetical protein
MNRFIKLTVVRRFKEDYNIIIDQFQILSVRPKDGDDELNGTEVKFKDKTTLSVAEDLAYFEGVLL